jgi:hypothetical protein
MEKAIIFSVNSFLYGRGNIKTFYCMVWSVRLSVDICFEQHNFTTFQWLVWKYVIIIKVLCAIKYITDKVISFHMQTIYMCYIKNGLYIFFFHIRRKFFFYKLSWSIFCSWYLILNLQMGVCCPASASLLFITDMW